MDSIYSAANTASRAIFGETTDQQNPNSNLNSNPNHNLNSNPNQPQNRTNPHAITDTTTSSSSNPFRADTSTDSNNPFRHATDSTSYNADTIGGSGTQHTSGSALDGVHLNKPPANFETASTGSTQSADFGSFDHARNFNNPDSSPFEHGVTKPITTTSEFDKPSIGDFNKDGTRRDGSGFSGVTSEDRPTISDITSGNTNTNTNTSSFSTSAPTGASARPVTSEHDQLDHSANTGIGGSTTNYGTSEHDQLDRSGGAGIGESHYKPSTTNYGTSKHTADPTHFDRPDTHSFSQRGDNHGSGAFASGIAAAEEGRRSNTDLRSSTRDSDSDFNQENRASTFPRDSNRDSTSNLHDNSNLHDSNLHDSNLHDSHNSTPSHLSTTKPSSSNATNAPSTSGTSTANPAPKSLISGVGSGPGTAVETSTGADPSSGQKPTPKQQGADRPQESPDQPEPHQPQTEEEKKKSAGTGEKYEKSTGMAAEGGDFDASRPGAGREADRLLDEKGIHHGKEVAPDMSQITAPHSKLLPHKKDKDTAKPEHKEHEKEHKDEHKAAEHKTAEHKTAEHKTAEHKPVEGSAEGDAEHKGLGTKIKEKLHLGHH